MNDSEELGPTGSSRKGITLHPLTPDDGEAMAGLRKIALPRKGQLHGTAAREPFDQIMGHTPAADGVAYEAGTVGGIEGWWCRPPNARSGQAILYLHGGWYVWGSAFAYRSFVGHIAARAGLATFVPDYRLAPEHPFPAAVLDAQACYRGLVESGIRRMAVMGDSAGGGLALVLLSLIKAQSEEERVMPVGAVVLSPVTDLTLTNPSWEEHATSDLYFTRSQAATLVETYLGGHAPQEPLASAIHGGLGGLPPIRVHVGEDEMLLDDSLRYVERAIAAGVDARVDVWRGMQHVFPTAVGGLQAAAESLDAMGAFLADRLNGGHRAR